MRRVAKSIVVASAGIMLVVLLAAAMTAGVEQSVLDTTCKVSTSSQPSSAQQCATKECGGSVGTGFAFFKDAEYVYVMTNRHVVGSKSQGKTVYTTWWTQGRQTVKIPMFLVAVSQTYDLAVGRIRIGRFGRRVPRIVPLASDLNITMGQVIVTAGCPGGDWSTATQGHIVKPLVDKNVQTSFLYLPKPRHGRSGSAIFNADGTEVVGLCYQFTSTGYGKAYNSRVLRHVFRNAGSAGTNVRFRMFPRKHQCNPTPQPVIEPPIPSVGVNPYPGLPNIDVDVDIAKPAIKTIGMGTIFLLMGITFVVGFVYLLGKQVFSKIR